MAAIDQALGYQQAGTDNALGLSTEMYNQGAAQMAPYMAAGANALPALTAATTGVGGWGDYSHANEAAGMNPNISVDYESMQSDPMYNFVRDRMLESNSRRANAGGYTGDIRGQWDRNAEMESALGARDRIYGEQVDNFNRGYGQNIDQQNFKTQMINDRYNKLSGFAGMGQNAATNFANTGAQYANAQGNMMTGMANAQASGVLGNNAIQSQQDADQNSMYAGLAGNALGGIFNNWDTISGWF